MKIVIICSLSQKDDIEYIANAYKKAGHTVDYPIEQPDKDVSRVIEDYLYRIAMADAVVAKTKDDGSFDIEQTYELAFARFLKKPINVIDG